MRRRPATIIMADDDEPDSLQRRSGRPSREEAERLHRVIIGIATRMFLTEGYGATSIDAIAREARMSKRTFYHRFRDKADLFAAVAHDVMIGLRPSGAEDEAGAAALFAGAGLPEILLRVARLVLNAALAPQAIALSRVILAEAPRFPELAKAVLGEGSRQEAVRHISALLERERRAGRVRFDEAQFAAEQFLQMVVSIPQRRAMGLGVPMGEAELEAWSRQTVRLFVEGVTGG